MKYSFFRKQKIGLLLLGAWLIACVHVTAQSPSKKQPVKLFNGQNLEGWYTFLKDRGRDTDPKKVFTVVNGQLRVSGEEYGCVTSEKEYGNYKLTVEFRWGGKTFPPRVNNARDNGILLHSNGADGGYSGIWMHSIECQLIEGGSGDILVVGDGSQAFAASTTALPEKQGGSYVYDPKGDTVTIHDGRINWYGRDPEWKDALGFRGARDVEKKVGQWNRIECISRGDQISVFLNGKLVNRAFNVKPSKGRIQIQSEGAEIFFRRIDLRELE